MSAWQAQDGLVLLRRHVAGDVLLFCGGGSGVLDITWIGPLQLYTRSQRVSKHGVLNKRPAPI